MTEVTINADFLLKLASFFFSIAAMIYAYFVNRRKDVDERFAEGSARMDRHDGRIQSLEQTIKTMPGKDEMHELQIALVQQAGALNEIRAMLRGSQDIMSRLEAIVSRHEDHLLNGGGK